MIIKFADWGKPGAGVNADGNGPAATAAMRVTGPWALDDNDDVVVGVAELFSIGESM